MLPLLLPPYQPRIMGTHHRTSHLEMLSRSSFQNAQSCSSRSACAKGLLSTLFLLLRPLPLLLLLLLLLLLTLLVVLPLVARSLVAAL
jgi:hypothetical protein